MKGLKIKSIKKIGSENVYNLTMKSKQHNYIIPYKDKKVGIVSKNCCSYAFICYQGAWLKTYYPTEFICATLTSKASKSDEDLEISIEKFKHEYPELKVSPPNINLSKNFYYPAGDLEVVAPLMSLKGVGEKISRRIIENQKYLSIPDFLARSGANKRAIDIFLEVGALCDFGEKEKVREEILSYNRLMKNVTGGSKVKDTGVSSIF